MILGILIPEFPSQTHAFFWREIQALRDAGAQVRLLSTRRPPADACRHAFAAEAAADTFYAYPPRPLRVLRGLLRTPLGAMRALRYVLTLRESSARQKLKVLVLGICGAGLADYCRQAGIQHIHVHSCADAAHVAALSRQFGGPAYSLHLHGDLPVYGVDHASKMAGAAFVSADARPMQRQVIDVVGLPAERTCTIWMSVDTRRFVPQARPPDASVHAVSVARLNACKGLHHALHAVRAAVDRGVDLRYSIAGTGPEEAALRRLIEQLGLRDRVQLLGGLGEHEVLQLLATADLFLLPSVGIGEASPVAVMEAMSCGIPPVASIIGGTPAMITSGVDGILLPQADEPALADALVRLAQNPHERRRLGQAARRRAVESFDSRRTAQSLLDWIARGRSPGPQPMASAPLTSPAGSR